MPGCSSWVFGNAGAEGYYRNSYEPQALRTMASNVEQAFTPGERIVLLRDDWAGVRSEMHSIADFMALTSNYRSDRAPEVVQELLARLKYIGDYLLTDTDRAAYQRYVRNLLQPQARELGWTAAAGESDERRALRAQIIETLGSTGEDPEVIAEARQMAEKALENPMKVDATMSAAVFHVAAMHGDAALYDKLRARLKSASSPEQYYMYLFALAEFSDPALLQRTLELALTPEVRNQDAFILIAQVMQNPAGSKLAWDFSRAHWADIQKIGGTFAGPFLVQTTAKFCDPQSRDQIAAFFAQHQVSEAERTLRQTLESINSCIDLKARQSQELAAWLQHSNAASAGQ
jgi:aminopeptidase N/puromycin-sensitive aminopeptidase